MLQILTGLDLKDRIVQFIQRQIQDECNEFSVRTIVQFISFAIQEYS